jgi:hypothetical protein
MLVSPEACFGVFSLAARLSAITFLSGEALAETEVKVDYAGVCIFRTAEEYFPIPQK